MVQTFGHFITGILFYFIYAHIICVKTHSIHIQVCYLYFVSFYLSPFILFIFIHLLYNLSHLLYIQSYFIYIVILFKFIGFVHMLHFIFPLIYIIYFRAHLIYVELSYFYSVVSQLHVKLSYSYLLHIYLILPYSNQSVREKFMWSKWFSDQLF